MSRLTDALHEYMAIEKPAVKEENRWYATQDMKEDIEKIQTILQQIGINKGDRVLLGLPNSYTFLCAFLAIIDYGATVATINPAMTEEELNQFVGRCKPVCGFICESHASLLSLDRQSSLNAVVLFEKGGHVSNYFLRGKEDLLFQAWFPKEKRRRSISEPSEEDIAILLYTSGTTGVPKAVGLSHQQIYAAVQHIIQSHRLTKNDRAYNILPLFHVNAQVVTLLSTILSGGSLVMAPKFSASKFWHVVTRDEITWVSAVPAIISILLQIPKPIERPRHLRFIRSASAPLSLDISMKFSHTFAIPLIQSYGMTEAASQICVHPIPPLPRKAASVGLPYGVDLKIIDAQEQEVRAGEAGEIIIRGDNIITSYLDNAGSDSFQGGWFHTGDVGYEDEDGYVYIVGRKKELINRGGEKVSPYEVEQVIRNVPGVEQAAVIGLPDMKYGERIVAFITRDKSKQLADQFVADAVMAQCRSSLSPQKCPEQVIVIDRIPVGPTGKVQRSLLKKQILTIQKEQKEQFEHV